MPQPTSLATRLRSRFQFMRGNILVLSITNLLGNFSRAMVFPTLLFIRDPQEAEA